MAVKTTRQTLRNELYQWTASPAGVVSTSLVSGTYRWIASGSGTNEYYVELVAGGDPSLAEPHRVQENAVDMTLSTLGSLAAGEWAYGDNDTLGFETVYVRLSDGTDPDTKAGGYVAAEDDVYYLEASGGGDPSVTEPTRVLIDGSALDAGVLGSLASMEWAYGDDDTLGFDTIYIRLPALLVRDPDDLTYSTGITCEYDEVYYRSIEMGERSPNAYIYAPVTPTTLSADTWTQVAAENPARELLGFINHDTATAYFAVQSTTPSGPTYAVPVPAGGMVFWDVNAMVTGKVWAYSVAGGVIGIMQNSNT